MKKVKLTKAQKKALDLFSDGKEYNAYELQVSCAILNALVRKGFLFHRFEVGTLFSPRTAIMYRLKPGV